MKKRFITNYLGLDRRWHSFPIIFKTKKEAEAKAKECLKEGARYVLKTAVCTINVNDKADI